MENAKPQTACGESSWKSHPGACNARATMCMCVMNVCMHVYEPVVTSIYSLTLCESLYVHMYACMFMSLETCSCDIYLLADIMWIFICTYVCTYVRKWAWRHVVMTSIHLLTVFYLSWVCMCICMYVRKWAWRHAVVTLIYLLAVCQSVYVRMHVCTYVLRK